MPETGSLRAPAALHLPPGVVHVWRADLEPPPHLLERLRACLSEDERARAARFRFPAHQVRYAAGRGILRVLLGRYLRVHPADLRFGYTSHGKPFLERTPGMPDLRFNLSNAEARALVAFSISRDVGVDLEDLKPMPDALSIATRFFSGPENEVFRTIGEEVRELAFFTCWTRKEAYIKAVGEGLSMPLDRFDVTFAPGEPAHLVATRPDPAEVARWKLVNVDPGPGHVGALMAEGQDWTVELFDWAGEYV
jgi:4'-phosphopantetheinyl transferase